MMNILRLIAFAVVMLALSGICNGQGRAIVGSPKGTDTNVVRAYITKDSSYQQLQKYATSDSNKVLGTDSSGNVVLRTRGLQQVTDVGMTTDTSIRSNGIYIADTLGNTGRLVSISNRDLAYPGTVSTSTASTTITGTNTVFRHYFRKGDSIQVGANKYYISAIADDVSLTISTNAAATVSGAAYSNATVRPILALSATGKLTVGNAEFLESTPWFNLNNIVDPGTSPGVWTANSNMLNRLTLNGTAATNSSLQVANQSALFIGATNVTDYTGDLHGTLSFVTSLSGATGTLSRATGLTASVNNAAAGMTITNGYGIRVPSFDKTGAITNSSGVTIGAQTGNLVLMGTENIPAGNTGLVDSSGYPWYIDGAVTVGDLSGVGSRMVTADADGLLSTAAIPTGGVTDVTATSPLSSTGGTTPNISMTAAASGVSGYVNTTTQRLGSGLKTADALQVITSTTDTGNNPIRPIQANNTIAFTTSAYTSAYTAYLAQPIISASNTQNWTNTGNSLNNGGLGGFTFTPTFGGSGTITLTGGFMSGYNTAGSAMVFGTIRQYLAKNPTGSAGGITNLVGFHAEQQTRATNNVGFLYGTQTTGNYAFYNSTSDNNDLGTGRTIMTTPNIRSASTPSGTADAGGSTGDLRWDADYLYVKTAAGWKRAALTTW